MPPFDKESYQKFYLDPRWQKKGLEVMSRDRFTCLICGSTTETLNVHHCYYENGMKPWEYETNSLKTLCEGCHKVEQHKLSHAKRKLMKRLGSLGYFSKDYFCLLETIETKEKFSNSLFGSTESEEKKKAEKRNYTDSEKIANKEKWDKIMAVRDLTAKEFFKMAEETF